MKTWNWLRVGMIGTGMLAAGLTASLGACSSDDEPASPDAGSSGGGGNGSSSGATSSSSSGGGGGSSSGGSSSGALPPTATLAVGHGYAELGPIKICFAQSEGEAPPPGAIPTPSLPLPGATPIPPGAIGPLPKLGVDLQNVHILPYLVKASSLVGRETLQCTALIGPSGVLQKDVDYFAGPNIAKGTLKDDHAYVLFAHRPVGEAADAGFTDLALYLQELDTTTVVPADKVGIQFIHGSRYLPPVSPFLYRPGATGPADAGDDDAGDAGEEDAATPADPSKQFLQAADAPRVMQVAPPTPMVLVDAMGAGLDTGFGVRFDTPGGPMDILHVSVDGLTPNARWAALSDPKNVQSEGDAGPDGGPTSVYFESGRAFTFMLFGDPAKTPEINPADPLTYYAAPHLVVLPNRAKSPTLGAN